MSDPTATAIGQVNPERTERAILVGRGGNVVGKPMGIVEVNGR